MASLLPIPTILSVADISQYLAANDISQGKKLKSGFLAPSLSVQIFLAKTVVRWMYNLNPSNSTLTQTSNYLFQLLGSYAITAQNILNNVAGGLATISNPANVSINVGQNAVFSVTITSASPYTIAWYKNGVIIPGATGLSYTLTNAQLSDTASTFYAVATNASGPISSGVAVLTVTAALLGQWCASDTDYSAQLESGIDSVVYNGTFPITDGQPLIVPFPIGQIKFIVVKYPVSQSVKVHYANPTGSLDQGAIPGLALEGNTFGGSNYIFSQSGAPFGINNISGQVTFS